MVSRMLDNFIEIYERELENYEYLTKLILSSAEVRMFVYEVCINCQPQPAVARKPTSKEIWEWAAKVSAAQPTKIHKDPE